MQHEVERAPLGRDTPDTTTGSPKPMEARGRGWSTPERWTYEFQIRLCRSRRFRRPWINRSCPLMMRAEMDFNVQFMPA